jgi:NAD(P)-dependent dehydrogenase (short-subunit alcohol dehydrogenase family)
MTISNLSYIADHASSIRLVVGRQRGQVARSSPIADFPDSTCHLRRDDTLNAAKIDAAMIHSDSPSLQSCLTSIFNNLTIRQTSAMSSIDTTTLFSLSGKTALITGGSRGIGKMIAEGFVRSGAKVYITSRKQEACEQAASELSVLGPCHALPSDVATAHGRGSLLRALEAREASLHILVNNAGTNWGESFSDYPEEGFRKVIDLNLAALFFLTRDMTPMLERAARRDDPSRVINIGSIDGLRVPTLPIPTFAYSASKAAVHQLTKVLAVTLAPKQITVNAVAPGFFESKMTTQTLREHYQAIEEACPLHRIGNPEEMAGIAIYLASKAGAYTNGAVIPVDGGASISS